MKTINLYSILPLLAILTFIQGCTSQDKKMEIPAKPVSIEQAIPIREDRNVILSGRTDLVPGSSPSGRLKDYKITVQRLKGATPHVTQGQTLRLRLPLVHNSEASAKIVSITPDQIVLDFPRQVQELGGQQVKVEVPLLPQRLYRIPFQAVYSPLGSHPRIFVIKEGHAYLKDLEVIASDKDSSLIVSADLEPGTFVIIKGQDNLLSGDPVRVFGSQEKKE